MYQTLPKYKPYYLNRSDWTVRNQINLKIKPYQSNLY